jgi:pyruvate kinase
LDCILFVKPRDLQDLQELIAEHSDYKIPIIAKSKLALENIDKIVAYCDALMVEAT